MISLNNIRALWMPCALACTHAMAADFIRQIDFFPEGQLVMDIPVSSPSGEITSRKLDAEFSVFQLYALHVPANNIPTLLKLDEKSVGTFLPQVTMETWSEDPHVPTSTRADRPYGVRITVSGLRNEDSVPEYAKSVMVQQSYTVYSPATYAPTNVAGDYADALVYQSNGVQEDPAVIQQLPVASPTKAVGKEIFSAHLRPESGEDLTELASAEVMIWPVSTAMIQGLVEGKVYKLPPDAGQIALTDAYPRSRTYAQIYPGPESLGTVGETIEGSTVVYGSSPDSPDEPQNANISLGSLAPYIQESGTYTLEVLTVTSFNHGNPERLAHVTFEVDLILNVNSMIVDSES